MDLNLVLEDIRKAGEQKLHQVTRSVNQQVEALESAVADEANQASERILSEGQIDLNRRKAIILQKTEIQKLQTLEDARQALIQEVLDGVSKRIAGFREEKGYKETLAQFVEETIQAIQPALLEGQKIIIHCDKKDEKNVGKKNRESGVPIEFVYDLDQVHGCEGEASDHKIVVRNSLEARFERSKPAIQQYLSLYFDQRIKPS